MFRSGRTAFGGRIINMALRAIRIIVPSGLSGLGSVNIVQKAGVHTSPVRGRGYGWWSYFLGDRITPRLTHFSKIISIEGNLASGKGAFGQKLADKLGMLYMPKVDIYYLNKMLGEKEPYPSGCDGFCSLEKFYTDPKAADGNSYRLQHWMYFMRLLQYSDAIEHMLSTGQGVILERTPFSEMVFLEAMFRQGYIRKECVNFYNEMKHLSLCKFLPPHLIIYIDKPAEEVQKKLKQSSKPYLHNVPLAYLKSIEDSYKKSYLPTASEDSELLAYDVTQSQDIEKVVEDIGNLTFEKGPWVDQDDVSYHHLRILVQNKNKVGKLTNTLKYLPEITLAGEFAEKYKDRNWHDVMDKADGHNGDKADKFVLFK